MLTNALLKENVFGNPLLGNFENVMYLNPNDTSQPDF